jgi:hypothetical protein
VREELEEGLDVIEGAIAKVNSGARGGRHA